MIKGLAPGMTERIVFACSNEEKPENIVRGYPGYRCLQFVWSSEGYIFSKNIVAEVTKPPLQVLWDEKQCVDCKVEPLSLCFD